MGEVACMHLDSKHSYGKKGGRHRTISLKLLGPGWDELCSAVEETGDVLLTLLKVSTDI